MRPLRLAARIAVLLVVLALEACAMVGVKHVRSTDAVAERRADVVDSGRVSDSTVQSLNVEALTVDGCHEDFPACRATLAHSSGLDDEQRLSALAELWVARALALDRRRPRTAAAGPAAADAAGAADAALDAWLEAARHAYAYLFHTRRAPTERAFELRQSQVLGFYNLAAEHIVERLFNALPLADPGWSSATLAGWTVHRPQSDVRLAGGARLPEELLPAGALRFKGVRNIYRRDGFGSDFVAIAAPPAEGGVPWREPRYVASTSVVEFPGATLEQVLATREVRLLARDPYRDDHIAIAGRSVPLGANFTAPYAVWLARSGFAGQSIRSLLGREGGIQESRVLLMQPFDPDRLVVVMLHGLASSPEAWINVGNEVLGDDALRRNYQVWEVYYPTNLPLAVNLANIRKALDATLAHFDPAGTSRAAHDMVLVGHSMGGVLARLLVSSSGQDLWGLLPEPLKRRAARVERLHRKLAAYLEFTPMPQVTRAVFLAAPHRGTPVAQNRLARWIGALIRLPVSVLKELASIVDPGDEEGGGPPFKLPNSIDNLSDKDPFVLAAAHLPIAPGVRFHTIVGEYKAKGPLLDSSDGVVPYRSAHLDGAASELVVPSWHSVQETPEAILEIRRILRLHLASAGAGT